MSHSATSWAVKAATGRGLNPAAKLVLWHLADRHNPDFGCFPSQERLADDCEVSRSQLNVHLAALERAGLIRRVRQTDEKTRQRKQTRYMLGFEVGFEPLPNDRFEADTQASLDLDVAEPCPEIRHGAMSGNQPKPCPEISQSHVRPTGHKPVREPLREPCVRPINADADAEAFEEFWQVHPRPKSEEACRQLFADAVNAGEDQQAIIDGAKRYAKEQAGNRSMYICQSDNWLRSRRWREGSAPVAAGSEDAKDVAVLWAKTIRRNGYVPPNAISPALARDMLDRGLVDRGDLARIGVSA